MLGWPNTRGMKRNTHTHPVLSASAVRQGGLVIGNPLSATAPVPPDSALAAAAGLRAFRRCDVHKVDLRDHGPDWAAEHNQGHSRRFRNIIETSKHQIRRFPDVVPLVLQLNSKRLHQSGGSALPLPATCVSSRSPQPQLSFGRPDQAFRVIMLTKHVTNGLT